MSLSLTGVMAALAKLPLNHQLWLYRYYFWVAAAVLLFSALVIAGVYVIRYACAEFWKYSSGTSGAYVNVEARFQ